MLDAIFIDRDGVINEDLGYVYQPKFFIFKPEIFQLIRYANKAKISIFVVTNQSGVARGFFTIDDVHHLHNYMISELQKKNLFLEHIYVCPHLKDGVIEKYSKDCNCRKPNPGMILSAASDFDIDLSRSILIGDKLTDVQAGIRAQITKNYLISKKLVDDPDNNDIKHVHSISEILDEIRSI